MALIDEMADYLIAGDIASSSGAGVGWYLTRGMMPDSTASPDRMVALVKTGGDPQLPGVLIDLPTFDVIVRGACMAEVSSAYTEARKEAQDVRDRLHFATVFTVDAVPYPGVIAVEEPHYDGEDGNQRPVFRCGFRAVRSAA